MNMNKLQHLEIIRDKIFEVVTVGEVLSKHSINHFRGRCACPICGSKNKTTFGFDKVTFNCFKCGVKGNMVDLAMELNNIDFEEALKKINYDFGLGFDFEKELDSLTINKWEYAKKKREEEEFLERKIERQYKEVVKRRQECWSEKQGFYNFIDEALDNGTWKYLNLGGEKCDNKYLGSKMD